MTPVSPYAVLVAEFRAQAYRHPDTPAGPVYLLCARQLAAIEAQDIEHAAIWRQRWEYATGAIDPVDLRTLTDGALDDRVGAIVGHLEAVRKREQQLEAEMLACEMEMEGR